MDKKRKRYHHGGQGNQPEQKQQQQNEAYFQQEYQRLRAAEAARAVDSEPSSHIPADTLPSFHDPQKRRHPTSSPPTVTALSILLFLQLIQPAITAQAYGPHSHLRGDLGDSMQPFNAVANSQPLPAPIINIEAMRQYSRSTDEPLAHGRRATEGLESHPDIAITTTGDIITVCEIKNSQGKDEIYLQSPLQDPLLLSPANVKCANPKVASLTDGRIKVTWAEKNTATGYDIKGCYINADLTIDKHFTVANSTAKEKNVAMSTAGVTAFEIDDDCQLGSARITSCEDPQIASVNGLNVLAYDDGTGISVRTSSQSATDLEQLRISTLGKQPSLATATYSNNVAISYTEDDSIRLQIMSVNADGSFSNRTTSAITSPASTRQSSPHTIALPNGFAIAYQTDENQHGLDSYIAFFDQNGNAVGEPTVIHNSHHHNNQENPRGIYGNDQLQLVYNNNGITTTTAVDVPVELKKIPAQTTPTIPEGVDTNTSSPIPPNSNSTIGSDHDSNVVPTQSPTGDIDNPAQGKKTISSDTILAIIAFFMASIVSGYGAILCASAYWARKKKEPANANDGQTTDNATEQPGSSGQIQITIHEEDTVDAERESGDELESRSASSLDGDGNAVATVIRYTDTGDTVIEYAPADILDGPYGSSGSDEDSDDNYVDIHVQADSNYESDHESGDEIEHESGNKTGFSDSANSSAITSQRTRSWHPQLSTAQYALMGQAAREAAEIARSRETARHDEYSP